ncbi:hypothetical protein, partial [Lunatibacter salilacus]|uniref:hypothetical protein n=1 Tax=Lunatibacter salilacus TaxID=2483804 RepID=UPI00131A68E9
MNYNKTANRLKSLLRISFLSFLVLTFVRCATQELEYIQPYQFVNEEFDGIGELPAVDDDDPVILEPEYPEIDESAEAEAFLDDLAAAESEADVDAFSVNLLEQISEFVEEQPDGVSEELKELAEELSEADIMAMFEEGAELDPGLLALVQDALGSSDIGFLFPTITIPPGLTEEDPEGRKDFSTDLEKNMMLENLRTATLVGPCADEARDAFNRAVDRLEASRTALLATTETNYQNRLTAAQQRLVTRNAAAFTIYQSRLQFGIQYGNLLLAAANSIARFNPAWANYYRWYALLYLVNLRSLYGQMYTLSLRANQVAFMQETTNALLQRNLINSIIEANF